MLTLTVAGVSNAIWLSPFFSRPYHTPDISQKGTGHVSLPAYLIPK